MISSMCINTCREGANKMEAGSFEWCPVTGPDEMGTNRNTEGSV